METNNNQTEAIARKKTNTGKIGFILTLAAPLSLVVPLTILGLISSLGIALLLYLIPPILFFLSIIYCIHGLLRKRSQKLATAGLLINVSIIIILFFLFIPLTPPGSMPYPLNIYKFKRACPEAVFWLDFDKEHIKQVQSQNFFIFGNVGTVYFTSLPNTYTAQQIIQCAETNGWKYHVSIPASKFQSFLNVSENNLSFEEMMFRSDIISMNNLVPFLMEQGDSVLIFETENYLGAPSLAVLSEKRDEVRVYYNNPVRPDPASDFSLPPTFDEFQENNNEDDHED